jgi:hypothetical protein
MENARAIVLIKIAFRETAGHLHADTQHGFSDFNVLTLQENFGICREIQRNQGPLVLSAAQFNAAVRQLDNF